MLALHSSSMGPSMPLEHHFDSSPPFSVLTPVYGKEISDARMEYKHSVLQVGIPNGLEKSILHSQPVTAIDSPQNSSVINGFPECPRLPTVISKPVPAGLYRLPTLDGYAFAMVEDDEDDFESDCDDFLDDDDESDWENQPESTTQLLNFAAAATSDIQRYFGRNKGNEDFCDVFEDKFKTMKSGRELYYADLLALAQFGDNSDAKPNSLSQGTNSVTKPLEIILPTHTIYTSHGNPIPCRLPHEGHLQSHVGLGPFQELFDSVLRDSLIKDEVKSGELIPVPAIGKHTMTTDSDHKMDAMWEETSISALRGLHHTPSSTLDFSDLLARWTVDGPTYT